MSKIKDNKFQPIFMNIHWYLLVSTVIFLGIFGFAQGAEATTYYVRTDGNNNCNGLTDVGGSFGNCAFRDIQNGVNTAQSGDIVIVHTGDYTSAKPTFVSRANGTDSNPITIQAFTGETVSISRATITHNYNIVKGFRVTGSGGYTTNGIQLNGNYNQALDNTVLGVCRGDGSCSGIGIAGDHNTVSYNKMDGQDNNANTSFCRAFYISGSYNEITYNTVTETNSIERVFELYGVGNHIANNEVRNIAWTIGSGAHPDIFQTFGSPTSRDHVIERNYFHDMSGQVGNLEANGQQGDASNVRDWTFRNNIFANITMEFFNHVPRINWYNNTFYRVTTSNTGWVLYNGYEAGGGKAYNNAFISCGTGSSNGWYTGATGDYNFVSNTNTGDTKSGFNEVHGVNGGNPQLVAPFSNCSTNTCDFHVGVTSVLIDRATIIDGYTTDKDSVSRPQVSAWDIGAYEYVVSGPPDTTPPSSITNLSTSNPTSYSVTLRWTSHGDDGSTGTASSYDIRYSTSNITEVNWSSATQVNGEPTPLVAGTPQSMVVSGLLPDTIYYFAIKTRDEVPTNWSDISNVSSATTAEAPSGLIEAETGTITSPMQKVLDSDASGGEYIQTLTTDLGTATYIFNIPVTGIYKIIARVYALGDGQDSLYFKIDSQSEDTWDFNPSANSSDYNLWREDELTKRGTGTFDNPQYDPYTLQLIQGSHTITFRGREVKAKLDYFRFAQTTTDTTPPSPPTGLAVN